MNQTVPPPVNQEVPPQINFSSQKKRHGCLTAWLILLMIANPVSALIYILGGNSYSYLPGWYVPLVIILSLLNLTSAIALFKWKKWGFWTISAVTVIMFFINLSIGLGFASSVSGLVGIAILYGVLNIGNENKGWPQLE